MEKHYAPSRGIIEPSTADDIANERSSDSESEDDTDEFMDQTEVEPTEHQTDVERMGHQKNDERMGNHAEVERMERQADVGRKGHQQSGETIGHQKDVEMTAYNSDVERTEHLADVERMEHQTGAERIGHQVDVKMREHQAGVEKMGHLSEHQGEFERMGHQKNDERMEHLGNVERMGHQSNVDRMGHQADVEMIGYQKEVDAIGQGHAVSPLIHGSSRIREDATNTMLSPDRHRQGTKAFDPRENSEIAPANESNLDHLSNNRLHSIENNSLRNVQKEDLISPPRPTQRSPVYVENVKKGGRFVEIYGGMTTAEDYDGEAGNPSCGGGDQGGDGAVYNYLPSPLLNEKGDGVQANYSFPYNSPHPTEKGEGVPTNYSYPSQLARGSNTSGFSSPVGKGPDPNCSSSREVGKFRFLTPPKRDPYPMRSPNKPATTTSGQGLLSPGRLAGRVSLNLSETFNPDNVYFSPGSQRSGPSKAEYRRDAGSQYYGMFDPRNQVYGTGAGRPVDNESMIGDYDRGVNSSGQKFGSPRDQRTGHSGGDYRSPSHQRNSVGDRMPEGAPSTRKSPDTVVGSAPFSRPSELNNDSHSRFGSNFGAAGSCVGFGALGSTDFGGSRTSFGGGFGGVGSRVFGGSAAGLGAGNSSSDFHFNFGKDETESKAEFAMFFGEDVSRSSCSSNQEAKDFQFNFGGDEEDEDEEGGPFSMF